VHDHARSGIPSRMDELAHPGGDYIAGRLTQPAYADGEIVLRSPADQGDLVARYGFAHAHLDSAVDAAREARRAFRKLGEPARAALLRAYQERLRAHAEPIAETIAREVGKPLWEARTEVAAMITKVDVSIGEAARFTRDEVIADLPGEIRHRPHGVLAVLGPFNFPGHLPNGQIVPALFAGNCVIFKPSERSPRTAVWMARCFDEAGFPAGSFQVVQGPGSIAAALVAHPGVDGVLFTGSLAVGQKILAATAQTPGKLVQLELGGKNASIVLDDCDVERTARELAFSGFATAGQRCTATSRVIVERGVADRLCERLRLAAERVVVGHPLDASVFMGPVISESSRAQLLAAQQRARDAGYEALAPGGAIEVPGRRGWYVRPAVHRAPRGAQAVPGYTDCELFGPDLAITVVDDADAALALANDSRFGLACAVYTASRARFEALADELEVGVVHWNRSSAGASGRLPFGGLKDSGNHRPAGLLAGAQCVYPLAVLLPAANAGPLPSWPGLALD
jgi:succinylglutamate-semialdehyde dehydrogenase